LSSEPDPLRWLGIIFLFLEIVILRPIEAIRDIVRDLTKDKPTKSTPTEHLRKQAQASIEGWKWPTGHDYGLAMCRVLYETNPHITDSIVQELWTAIAHITNAEKFLQLPRSPSNDLVAIAMYRDDLRKVISRHEDFDTTMTVFSTALRSSMQAFIDAIPKFEDATTTTTVPLEDVIQKPGEYISNLFIALFTQEVLDRDLFRGLRDQLDHNFKLQKEVDPLDAEGTTSEILNRYLYNTPLRQLTSAQIPFGIPRSAWMKHGIIAAPSGHGKTMTLGSIIHDFLQEEDPPAMFVIEPHNDLIDKLQRLAVFNGRLKDRLIVIDPADNPALNFLDVGDDMSAGVVESFKYLMSALSSELTTKQGTASAYLLMLTRKIPDATIDTLREIMDEKVRNITQSKFYPYIQQLEPHARDFFANQFYSGNMSETRLQVSQRLYTVLANDAFRRMFATPKNTFSAFDAMQNKKIVLVNASRDELTTQGASIFGRWMLTQIMSSAFMRPKHARHLCLVVLDEAHLYFDENTETILSELRKFGVGLCAATQFLDQIEDGVKSAIYANTAIKMSGPVSHSDANSLAKEMYCTPDFIRSCKMVEWKHAEFALYTKSFPKAVKITIPFGVIEDAPKMSEDQHRAFRQRNREKYGTSSSAHVNHENSLSQTHKAPATKASDEVSRPRPPSVTTTPPPSPSPNPGTDPHAGIDD
jgi:hypothetical protein